MIPTTTTDTQRASGATEQGPTLSACEEPPTTTHYLGVHNNNTTADWEEDGRETAWGSKQRSNPSRHKNSPLCLKTFRTSNPHTTKTSSDLKKENQEQIIIPHLLHPFYPQHLLPCWEQSGSIPPFTDPAPSHSVPCGTPSIHLPSWVSSSSVPAHWGDHWGPACSESGCLHSLSPKPTTSLFQLFLFFLSLLTIHSFPLYAPIQNETKQADLSSSLILPTLWLCGVQIEGGGGVVGQGEERGEKGGREGGR